MRGSDAVTGAMFSYVDIEARVPAKHPIRVIRRIVNEVLADLDADFAAMYAAIGRPSIAPEKLLRASLLQAFFTVRSERLLMERLDYDLMFRWFVGLGIDDPVWDHSTFSKNRDRLREADIARRFLKCTLEHREVAPLLSYMGHAMTENRHGLVVETGFTQATGTAEREEAKAMIERHSPGSARRLTVGADKAYDVAGFVADLRAMCVTPHIAQKTKGSAIDARTTRHPGYAVSIRRRKLVEEPFGWAKTIGGLARPKLKGLARQGFAFTFIMAAYDLVRLPKLIAATA